METIDEFLAAYRKQFEYYDSVARAVAAQLEAGLEQAGIRAIVTWRAKSVARLEPKVRSRNEKRQEKGKSEYANVQEIYDDLVDLAGVRVALYFPGQRDQVGTIIKGIFDQVGDDKVFPDGTTSKYSKRFAGYSAVHYRVRLRDGALHTKNKHYADAMVEIQVASVLMHAWSEVEHDLVYKPFQGNLSEEEYALLDQLNGLVMAGEMALEMLQQAGERRVTSSGGTFSNHYELASHILRIRLSGKDGTPSPAVLGRINDLFDLLSRYGLLTKDHVDAYLKSLDPDFESKPISDQIIDMVLAEDPSRYSFYQTSNVPFPLKGADALSYTAIRSQFLDSWLYLEKAIREKAQLNPNATPLKSARVDGYFEWFDPPVEIEGMFRHARSIRDAVVHEGQHFSRPSMKRAMAFIEKVREFVEGFRWPEQGNGN